MIKMVLQRTKYEFMIGSIVYASEEAKLYVDTFSEWVNTIMTYTIETQLLTSSLSAMQHMHWQLIITIIFKNCHLLPLCTVLQCL